MYQAVGSPQSRLTRVTWMLEELGEPYEIVNAKQHSETMYRYNPTGKIPALADGDFIVTDSAAICGYLAEKHADKGFGPRTDGERALISAWLMFAQSEFEAPMWNKIKHRLVLPNEMRLEVGPWTKLEFAHAVKALDAKLGDKEYAMGDRFTAPDVILGHCGYWSRAAKFTVESDRVGAYFERVLSRPALARAKEREATA